MRCILGSPRRPESRGGVLSLCFLLCACQDGIIGLTAEDELTADVREMSVTFEGSVAEGSATARVSLGGPVDLAVLEFASTTPFELSLDPGGQVPLEASKRSANRCETFVFPYDEGISEGYVVRLICVHQTNPTDEAFAPFGSVKLQLTFDEALDIMTVRIFSDTAEATAPIYEVEHVFQ